MTRWQRHVSSCDDAAAYLSTIILVVIAPSHITAEWSQWSVCSQRCGTGVQTRTCLPGGQPCNGGSGQSSRSCTDNTGCQVNASVMSQGAMIGIIIGLIVIAAIVRGCVRHHRQQQIARVLQQQRDIALAAAAAAGVIASPDDDAAIIAVAMTPAEEAAAESRLRARAAATAMANAPRNYNNNNNNSGGRNGAAPATATATVTVGGATGGPNRTMYNGYMNNNAAVASNNNSTTVTTPPSPYHDDHGHHDAPPTYDEATNDLLPGVPSPSAVVHINGAPEVTVTDLAIAAPITPNNRQSLSSSLRV